MYARLLTFTTEPGARSAMEELADQAYASMRSLEGFKSATFLGDDAVGEYVVLTQWESEEAAGAADEALTSVRQEVASIAKGPPTLRLFEVYEQKA